MLRKLSLAFAALLLSTAAYAANVPLIVTQPTINLVTAGAAWVVGATTITLSATCPANIPFNAAGVDDTGPTNRAIGNVSSCVGTTLTLTGATNFASITSGDLLSIAGVVPPNFSEPSQILASLNNTIQSINSNTSGIFASLGAPFVTSGTTANVVLTTGNAFIPLPGQMIRITAWGVNSADANAKTITVNFGASGTFAFVVTGSGQSWLVTAWITNVGTVASPRWQAQGWAQTAATVVTIGTATGTDAVTGPLTLNLTATAATSGTVTVNGAMFEYVK